VLVYLSLHSSNADPRYRQTWLDQALMAPRSSSSLRHGIEPWHLCLLCHAVVVGWFFTSMSLMEGKGLSGVVDSLNAVRRYSL
jgi:hypothetical protein